MAGLGNTAARLTVALVLALPAVAQADVFVRDDIILTPTPQRFSVCHGNGCQYLAEASLSSAQWAAIAALFRPPAASGMEERRQIYRAIALFERYVGEQTGTAADKGRNRRSPAGHQAEMDCIDESINTTTYLRILVHEGLLRHHAILNRATRGLFIGGWPHTTAVIRDRHDGSRWAVDSWFLDNGEPPFIIPLEQWRAGWAPDKP